MKNKIKPKQTKTVVLKSIAIVFVAAIALYLYTGGFGKDIEAPPAVTAPAVSSGNMTGIDAFAQCLTDQGAKMYGTTWCGYCNKQKEAFEQAFDLINFVDCDKRKSDCAEAGVKGYPTWVINGNNYPGLQSLDKLGSLSGCVLS